MNDQSGPKTATSATAIADIQARLEAESYICNPAIATSLFLAQLLRDKTEHADAPRQVAESLFGFFNQFFQNMNPAGINCQDISHPQNQNFRFIRHNAN